MELMNAKQAREQSSLRKSIVEKENFQSHLEQCISHVNSAIEKGLYSVEFGYDPIKFHENFQKTITEYFQNCGYNINFRFKAGITPWVEISW